MNARQTSLLGWIGFGAVAVVALWIGLFGTTLTFKPFTTGDVLRLLGSLALVALFVERTIEVSVGAWRGEVAEKLFSAAESAKLALLSAPASAVIRTNAAAAGEQLIDYRMKTKALALRAAVVMGLLVAAAGFRTLEGLVTPPGAGTTKVLFRLLDLVMTAATIGGGSEAVHRMISTATTYLDAASGQARARELATRSTIPTPFPALPPLTPGSPAR